MPSTEIFRKDLNKEGGSGALAAKGPESEKQETKLTCRTFKVSLGSFSILIFLSTVLLTILRTTIASTIAGGAAITTTTTTTTVTAATASSTTTIPKSRCAWLDPALQVDD